MIEQSVRLRGIAFVVSLLAAMSLLSGGTVRAHTGFESSTPSDGAVIDTPVDVVTINFTGEATPTGDEFMAFTPDGVLQSPASVETSDDRSFTIRFDPPLAGGQVGVRWNVRAADAHPIEGAFSFTVTAPASAPTTVATPTTTLAEPAVAENAPAEVAPTESSEAVPGDTVPPVTTVPEPAPTDTSFDAVLAAETELPAGGADVSSAEAAQGSTQSLDEFLTVDNSTPGQTTATVGRLIGLLGVTIGLGALAFVATALRGRRDEVQQGLAGVGVLGGVIVVGAAIEYVGVGRIGGEGLGSAWSSAPGFATVLRILGGIGLAAGLAVVVGSGRGGLQASAPARSLSSAVIDDVTVTDQPRTTDSALVGWTPDARAWPVFAGVALLIASFWFDGHTVSKGFRPLHALVNSVHLVAGAVWVGGVVALATVVWSRRQSGEPMRVAELVVRFSNIATIALVSVVLAGGVMAVLVLDSFGELTGTPWGKILLLKTAAVGLAIVGGAYNHFRLRPALEADPESPLVLARLRSTITAEAIMLVFVVVVTAWLVAAAS